eukprot:gene24231-9830_t
MARAAALEHYQAGRYPQAETKLIEALDCAKLGFEATDPHLASCMNNLAEFYRNMGQYDKAEGLYHEALDLLESIFGEQHWPYVSAMHILALMLEACRTLEQALDLLESIFGERHWLYVSAMHNLALMLEARGELEKALETMKQVVKLRLVMFGPLHFLYADSIFALAHIYNKLASKSRAEAAAAVATTASSSSTGGGAEKKAPADAAAQVKGSGWWGWIRFRRGGAKKPGDEEAKEAVALMAKAIGIMEEAETVQVNVVLYWLVELAEEHKRQGNMNPAVECMRKALHHFGSDKGEAMAQASQLSDRLVDFLLEGGRQADARTAMQGEAMAQASQFCDYLVGFLREGGRQADARSAMQACVSGRTATFGRELVVAQSMLRLATIEAGIKKAETDASALQNAANAAALAQELMTEYSKPTVSNWMGSAGSDKSLKRVQAGNVCGSAFKFVAALQKRMGSVADSETALKNAVDVYEGSCEAVKAQFKLLKASSSKPGASSVPTALVEEVSSLFVELHISLMDCLEQLAELVESRGQAGKYPWPRFTVFVLVLACDAAYDS